MTMEELAKKAYEAYGQFTNNKNFLGEEMPKWEDLPDKIRGAWAAATKEITKEIVASMTADNPG